MRRHARGLRKLSQQQPMPESNQASKQHSHASSAALTSLLRFAFALVTSSFLSCHTPHRIVSCPRQVKKKREQRRALVRTRDKPASWLLRASKQWLTAALLIRLARLLGKLLDQTEAKQTISAKSPKPPAQIWAQARRCAKKGDWSNSQVSRALTHTPKNSVPCISLMHVWAASRVVKFTIAQSLRREWATCRPKTTCRKKQMRKDNSST